VKPAFRRLVIFLLAAGCFVAGWALNGWFAVDACLDGGGRWKAAGGYCVGIP
jgi:hypothetical protein